jgi:hypothetical protein
VTVPVEASYVVDGVRQDRVIGVEYDPQSGRQGQPASAGPPQQGGGGPPLGLLAVVVVVGVVAVLGWRRYRG